VTRRVVCAGRQLSGYTFFAHTLGAAISFGEEKHTEEMSASSRAEQRDAGADDSQPTFFFDGVADCVGIFGF